MKVFSNMSRANQQHVHFDERSYPETYPETYHDENWVSILYLPRHDKVISTMGKKFQTEKTA